MFKFLYNNFYKKYAFFANFLKIWRNLVILGPIFNPLKNFNVSKSGKNIFISYFYRLPENT